MPDRHAMTAYLSDEEDDWRHEMLDWIEGLDGDVTPERVVADCAAGEWLVWLAGRLDYDADTLRAAVRPAALRAARVYAARACERAGFMTWADRLRGLADDADVASFGYACDKPSEAETKSRWATWSPAWSAVEAAQMALWAGAGREGADVMAMAAASAAWASCVDKESADRARTEEHARCADEVRAALPDLARRLREVLDEEADDA